MKKILSILIAILFTVTFIHAQVPVINSFSPVTGLVGSTVTITGSGFDGSSPANNQVFFGSAQATVLTSSFASLTVTVPAGATTNLISVRNVTSKLIGYSRNHFNGLFCSTPLNNTTYNSFNQQLGGIYGAYNIDIYDMDGDGKSDIITGNNSVGITVARNQSVVGTMNFTAFNINTNANVQQFFVADFDGDGKRDIIFSGGNGAYLYPNLSTPGNIVFGPRITVDASHAYYQCAAGDLNNDGKVDFVGGSNDGSNLLYNFRNTSTGPGNFSFSLSSTVNVSCLCRGIQCVDLDGDGKTDIATTNFDCNQVVALRNTTPALNSTFSFAGVQFFSCPGNPYRLKIADFDKDGKIDLVTPLYGSGQTGIMRNTSTVGTINFAPLIALPAITQNYRVGVGDVNGDGLPDIVTKPNGVSASFLVFKNISSGPGNIAFDPAITYLSAAGAEVGGIAIGDMDGDLVPDIATSGISTNVIRFHRNTSSVPDVTPPTAMCKNITVALSPTGTVTVTGAMIDNGSSDACGLGSMQINGSASVTFTCANVGPNNVTLTVFDLAGNSATCNAVVTVAPAAIIVSGQTTVCQGQTITLTANLGDSYQWIKDGNAIGGATSQTYIASASGSYQVTVTNAGGCSGTSDPVVITVNNNPTVTTSPTGNATLCPPSGNLTITASSSAIYQWYKNGLSISGATLQSYTATTAGSYTVSVIDNFGCSATSAPVVVNATDNIPPTVSAAANITANTSDDGTGNCTVAVAVPDAVFSDNCSATLSWVMSGATTASGTGQVGTHIFNIGVTTITYTATDLSSNTATSAMTVTVTDDENPVITCAPDMSVPADAGKCEAVVNVTTPTVTDNCGVFVLGNSLYFDGADDEALMPATSTINTANHSQRTVEAWFQVDDKSIAAHKQVIWEEGGNSNGINMYVFNNKLYVGAYSIGQGWSGNWLSTSAINSGQWYHVAVVLDATQPAASQLKGYLNGVLFGQASAGILNSHPDADAIGNLNNQTVFHDGAINNQTGLHGFKGHIDDIRAWVTARTQAEIQANMNIQLVGNEPGLVVYYNFDQGIACGNNPTETTLLDRSIAGLNATMNNFRLNTSAPDPCLSNWANGAPALTGTIHLTNSYTGTADASGTYPVGNTAVVWTATDLSGNTSTCTQHIIVNDTQNPTITAAGDVVTTTSADGTGDCTVAVAITDATFGDNCPNSTLSWVMTGATTGSGNGQVGTQTFNIGVTTITYTVTDAHNNTMTDAMTVTVTDDENPTVTAGVDVVTTTSVDGTGDCTVAVAIANASFADNCSGSTLSWVMTGATTGSGTGQVGTHTFNIGVTTITYTVMDAHGHSATDVMKVTVTDDENPMISCPSPITVNNTPNTCGAVINFTVTGTDNCTGGTSTSNVLNGDVTNTDFNNATSGIFSPSVTADKLHFTTNGFAHSHGGAMDIFVDVHNPVSGLWTQVFTFHFAGAGQFNFSGLDINFASQPVDQFRLRSNPAQNQSYHSWGGSVFTFSSSPVTIVSIPPSGSVFPVGTTTVNSTATDNAGNTSTCSFTVTVNDNQNPTVTAAPEVVTTTSADGTGNCTVAVAITDAVFGDNCTNSTLSWVMTGATTGTGNGQVGTHVFNFGVTTITYTVNDGHGNSATDAMTVTVTDNENPVIVNLPASFTVNAFANNCFRTVTWTAPTATDNCGVLSIVSDDPIYEASHSTTLPVGVNTITYTATDIHGNVTTASFTITVRDIQNPVITGCPANISVTNSTGNCGRIVNWNAPTASDNCSGVTLTSNHTPGELFPVGVTTVIYTATDASGNTATCTFTVTVTDTEKPVISCPGTQILNLNASCTATLPDYRLIAPVTDNCTATNLIIYTQSPLPGTTVSQAGTEVITLTATDAAGNVQTCTINVTKKDVTPPVITCPGNISVGNTTNVCGAVVTYNAPTATDNCGVAAFNFFSGGEPNNSGGEDNLQLYTSGAWNDLNGGNCMVYIVEFNSVNPNNIAGYTRIGVFGGHTYYVSLACATWTNARNAALGLGADLASINTLAESSFLAPYGGSTWVGGYQDHSDPNYAEPGNAAQNFGGWKWVDGTHLGSSQVTLTRTAGLASGSTFPIGVTTVTYTATDESGNTSTCSFTVTVTDTQAPVFNICPAGQNLDLDGVCSAVLPDYTHLATVSDNCTTASQIIITQSPAEGTTVNGSGPLTITLTARDAAGNTTNCSFTVTKRDITAPTITTCAPAQAANANANCQAAVPNVTGLVSATDNCTTAGSLIKTQSPAAGTLVGTGITTITITVTDLSGNSTNCTTTFTVTDHIAPQIISCAAPQSGNAGTNCLVALPDFRGGVTATDNCTAAANLVITQSPAVGTLVGSGVTTVTITVTDASGNSSNCTTTFTVTDVTAPVITCTYNQPALRNTNGANCTYTAQGNEFNATATDNCGVTSLTYSLSGVTGGTGTTLAGKVFNKGTTTVTWTAMDAAGNSVSCSFDVIVSDNSAPVISCPYPTTTSRNTNAANCTYAVSGNEFNATATDNCGVVTSLVYMLSGATTGSGTSLSGVLFNTGTTTVTWTAADPDGNSVSCSFDVIVSDNQDPVITCPLAGNNARSTDPNLCTYRVNGNEFNATATDNCAVTSLTYVLTGVTSGTGTTLAGVVFNKGITTVTWTARDAAGHTVTCNFNVVVNDNQLPDITCPVTASIIKPTDHDLCTYKVMGTEFDATATDNCGVVSLTYDLSGVTIKPIFGPYTSLAGLIFNKGVTHVTWTAVDAAGNTSVCSFDVNVTDQQAPYITCPGAVTLNCQDDSSPAATGVATATDNCSSVANIVITHTDVTTQDPDANNPGHYNYTITRTWRATDQAGNFSECAQVITVHDVTAPVITCPANVTVNCNDDKSSASTGVATATDNCSPVTITQTETSTQSADPANVLHYNYVISRTWRATDVTGNSIICLQTITVHDVTAPVITCPGDVTVNCQDDNSSVSTGVATATDNCAPVANIAITQSQTSTYSADPANVLHYNYVISRTWRATDVAGNYSNCTQTITVHDVTAPVITCPGDVTVNCQDDNSSASTGVATATDNCAPVANIAITQSQTSTQSADPANVLHYNYVITRTWRATDVAGNYSECIQHITVQDVTIPVITCPGAVTINCQDNSSPAATGVATATDNCAPVVNIAITHSDISTQNANVNSPAHYNYTITRTWRATDVVGNYNECVQVITVHDVTAPVINCPANVTVNCNDDKSSANTGVATASDNCSPVTITQTETSTYSADPANVLHYNYVISRTWRATDVTGNSIVCLQTITVRDVTAPVITHCPSPVMVNNTPGSCGATVTYEAATATDNCAPAANITITYSKASGTVFNVGTTTVTVTAKDVIGNTTTCNFTVTVTDNEKPVIACPANQVFCMVTAGTYMIPALTASDNCGISTVTYSVTGSTTRSGSGYDASGAFNVGVSTIVWTVKDVNNNTQTCSMTVTINPLPVASIAVGNSDAFCNGITLTASSNLNGTSTYQWYTSANVLFATSQSVTLGNGNADGTYTVYVTSDKGCRSLAGATYVYTKQNQLGNYSIIATKDLKFEAHQNVLSGSVGIIGTTSTGSFDIYDSIPYPASATPGAFVKGASITYASPLYIPNRYTGSVTVTLPPVFNNTSVPTGTNFTVTTNNWVQPTGVRYKDITINAGLTATLTDTLYQNITVNAGARVIFSRSNVNLKTLTLKDGTGAGATPFTQVSFSSPRDTVKVSYAVELGSYNKVNPEGNTVTFYMSDGNTDAENFHVMNGHNSVINANVYIPIGQLFVEKKDNTPRCYMNGMFIAQNIHSDFYVTWNGNSCNGANVFTQPVYVNTTVPEPTPVVTPPLADRFEVKIYPNPTPGDFNIQVISNSTDPVMVRILDVNGVVMQASTKMTKQGLIGLANRLPGGTYFVEVTQGKNRRVEKLIKMN